MLQSAKQWVLLHPCQEIIGQASCIDGATTGLLQPPCSIPGCSWDDISALRSSLLAGYICLWVFPGGLVVAFQLQFLCWEDFHRLSCPFPWYPRAALLQGLCVAMASSAHRSHSAGSSVCDGEGEALQLPLAPQGCTSRNGSTGKFPSWAWTPQESSSLYSPQPFPCFPKHTNLSSSFICLAIIVGPCTRLWPISWQD